MTRNQVAPFLPGKAAVVAAAAADIEQYLVFSLAGENFAIDILHIKEIIEYGQVTEVPMMPALVRGVINLRGAVVPVIDLAIRFGKARTEVGRRSCIVILEVETAGEQQVLGVMVDAVNEVIEIAAADIEPPPSFGTKIRADFIAGMGKVAGRFVIILNVNHVLSLEEISEITSLGAPLEESTVD